eukprot:m.435361 g.435361  ORF g.435361 m.435361 type:complete len:267 (+) comp21419_c0_seq94:95-895(+)
MCHDIVACPRVSVSIIHSAGVVSFPAMEFTCTYVTCQPFIVCRTYSSLRWQRGWPTGTFTMRGAIMNGGCVQPNSVVRVQLDAKNGSTASVQYISATLFEHISWKGPHHNDRSLCIMHARDYCDREARRRFRRAKVKTRITRSASQRQSVEKQVDAELIKNLDAGNGVFFNLHCHGANYSYEGKLIRNRLEVVIKVKTKYGASNPILSLNVDCAEPEEYSEETLTPLAATVTPGADDTDVRDKTEANSIDRTADNKESHEFDITLV